jgi:NDP-4-keto-2,6-dideoxyhexose 3-C-methyltransferase
MQDVRDVLADDGIWHFEQSYMPLMLATNSYDTVCHEHLEYYALRQIRWMTDRVGLVILDVERNDINGGSFAITVGKSSGGRAPSAEVAAMLREEDEAGLSTLDPYRRFCERTMRHREELPAKLSALRAQGRRVLGLGASTKGNVVLQFCKLGTGDLESIAEVNEDKFGCVTPGSRIPIISEEQAKALRPDVFLVLPWHFRPHFLKREEPFLRGGGRLLFPLPEIELVPP